MIGVISRMSVPTIIGDETVNAEVPSTNHTPSSRNKTHAKVPGIKHTHKFQE
jgi:hypothetical protein